MTLCKIFLLIAGQAWLDRLEAAVTFYSVHVGVPAMAAFCIAQHRIAQRAVFFSHRSKEVRREGQWVDNL